MTPRGGARAGAGLAEYTTGKCTRCNRIYRLPQNSFAPDRLKYRDDLNPDSLQKIWNGEVCDICGSPLIQWTNRGGARPGAGRPPADGVRMKKVTIKMPEPLIDRARRAAPEHGGFGATIRKALEWFLNDKPEKPT